MGQRHAEMTDEEWNRNLLKITSRVVRAIDGTEGVPAGTGHEVLDTLTSSEPRAIAWAAGVATAALALAGWSIDEAAEEVAAIVENETRGDD